MKRVKVVAVGSGMAEKALNSFVCEGIGKSRRPRKFEKVNGLWKGEISYGPDLQYKVMVEAQLVNSLANLPSADWYIVSLPNISGNFTSSPRRIGSMTNADKLPQGRLMVINDGRSWFKEARKNHAVTNVADQLSAQITGASAFRPEFLSFPSGEQSKHFQVVAGWVREEKPIQLVSGCCLNANETRESIVNELDPEITGLLARTAKAAFDQLPISKWYIYTFGPSDFDWLGDLGIQKVLLPYMWDAPKEKVLSDMEKNFTLVTKLGDELQSKVDFPVVVGQLSDYTEKVDLHWLVEASRERARQMLPKLMETPPAIFSQLKSEQDIFDRVQQEALLYLLDTVRWGQIEGEEKPAVLAAGLEVHGGYWAHGNLFNGPNGEFLPLSWFPQSVRQHWGPWVKGNHQLAKERARLSHMLSFYGY